ncbi:MAG TPA: redoxin domain-containing protein [Candidatus Paceibacterota bacterium]|nr:redoxin domain-containing protein [Candidatus Paceibacterota bacterium]
MATSKKIALAATIVLVIAAIWYLDSLKASPGSNGNGAAPVTINVPAATSSLPSAASSSSTLTLAELAAADQAAGYQPAIEITDPTGFINSSSSFRLANLVGKNVVLLDFWTYSCINCIRTIPYLTAWYARYHADGLEIVGIHTPEFDFEKDYDNVQAAVRQFGINYPVVLDSDYGTWDAYGNQYWPHEYLIDLAGYIVHDQVGEGNYDETEQEIQKLLAQRDEILGVAPAPMPSAPVVVASSSIAGGIMSPETYFGAARNEYLGNGTPGQAGEQSFDLPSSPGANTLYLGGPWSVGQQYAETAGPAEVEYQYEAKGIYFVAGTASDTPITAEVLRDGAPVPASAAGSDIFYQDGKSYVTVSANRLYRLVDDTAPGDHVLELIIPSAGLQAYTFTFG